MNANETNRLEDKIPANRIKENPAKRIEENETQTANRDKTQTENRNKTQTANRNKTQTANRIENENEIRIDDEGDNELTEDVKRLKLQAIDTVKDITKSSATATTAFGKNALKVGKSALNVGKNIANDNILTRNLTTTGAVLGKSADAVGNKVKAAIKTTGTVLGDAATALGNAKDEVGRKLGDAAEAIDNKLKDAAEAIDDEVNGAIKTTGEITGYNAAKKVVSRTFNNTLVTHDANNNPNQITKLLMDSNISTKTPNNFLTAAQNDLTNAKTAYTSLRAASINDKSLESAAKDAGARVKYAQAVVEFIKANNNDEDFIDKFIEFRKGQLSNITQVAERFKGVASSVGSTLKKFTPFSFSNSRTQKNQQGLNGLKKGVNGQKYTLTFFKDVDNQCYFEKCELCTEKLEQDIPEDRKVIDENNRQIRSNIQTIAKISPSLCDADANNANVAIKNDNSNINADGNENANVAIKNDNSNINADGNENAIVDATDANSDKNAIVVITDANSDKNAIGGYDANKKSRSVGTRRKSRSMKLGKNQARRSRRYRSL